MLRILFYITLLFLPEILLAGGSSGATATFPTSLDAYGDGDFSAQGKGIGEILSHRMSVDPFNLVGSLIFLCAILHTFVAGPLRAKAEHLHHEHESVMQQQGASYEEIERTTPMKVHLLHFLGEVEAIFGIWVIALAAAVIGFYDWGTFKHYMAHTVTYIEPMFLVVIMTLASTKPVLKLSEKILGVVAGLGGHSPAAWWLSILTIAPMLGSFITEPAAMTISALLLSHQFYDLKPTPRLAYATIGLLFVNVSVGGTVTHFAAPPVLMVAEPWGWTLEFMATHFGWKALLGIVISNVIYYLVFRKDLAALKPQEGSSDGDEEGTPVWITLVHLLFMAWTVLNAHEPPLFIGGFLMFLGFAVITQRYQGESSLKAAVLVGFFLAGLVTHGGVQAWWIAPVLGSLPDLLLMIGAAILTAFNDNAAITFLSTMVPGFTITAKYAVVAGAVTGGGLTVIANAPNPAGQSILQKYFPGGVNPGKLALSALIPTIIMGLCFMGLPTVSEESDPQRHKVSVPTESSESG